MQKADHMMKKLLFFIFIYLANIISANATEVKIAPHKAIYELSLSSASRGSSVVDANGKMVYELIENDTSWSVNNTIELDLTLKSGVLQNTLWKHSSVEAKNGDDFSFIGASFVNQEENMKIKGRAKFASHDSDKGFITFEEPSYLKKRIKRDVIFPISHTKTFLNSANNGKKIIFNKVFDGTSLNSLYLTNVVIGKQHDKEKIGSENLASWNFNFAFFSNNKSQTPDYEVKAQYYANGVAKNIWHDFGDFSIKGKLIKLIYKD